MLRTLAVAALVVPCLASAESRVASHGRARAAPNGAGLTLGSPTPGTRLDNLAVELRSGPADTRVSAVLTLSTAAVAQDGGLELSVPTGAQVTFLAITMGGVRRIAGIEEAEDARQSYEAIVAGNDDPALLSLTAAGSTTDTLRLRVFPLTRGKPAKVELIMTIPQATRFVIDPGGRAIPRVEVDVDGKQSAYAALANRRAVELPAPVPGEQPGETEARVTEFRALFIANPPINGDDDPEILNPERLGPRARREPTIRRRERGAFHISEDCLKNALCGVE